MKTGDFVCAEHPELGVQYGQIIQKVRVTGSLPFSGSIWNDGSDTLRSCFWYGRPDPPSHDFVRVRWMDRTYPPVLPGAVVAAHVRQVSHLEALAGQAT